MQTTANLILARRDLMLIMADGLHTNQRDACKPHMDLILELQRLMHCVVVVVATF